MSAADLAAGITATGARVLPGWLVARRLRLPLPLLAGFIGGATARLALVLAGDAAHVALSPQHALLAWGVVITVAATWAQRRPSADDATSLRPAAKWRGDWPLFAALAPVLAVVAYRTTTQPLFDVDTAFR
jgi:hypothetical protein